MSGDQTEMQQVNEVYQLYKTAKISVGTPLPRDAFEGFWIGMSVDDWAYWLRQFRSGTTTLSKEIIEDFEGLFDSFELGIPESDDDQQLFTKLRQRMERNQHHRNSP